MHSKNYIPCKDASLAGDSPSFAGANTLPHSPYSRKHARPYADLRVDVAEMELDRFFANAELCGDGFVGLPCKNQAQDCYFAAREIR